MAINATASHCILEMDLNFSSIIYSSWIAMKNFMYAKDLLWQDDRELTALSYSLTVGFHLPAM